MYQIIKVENPKAKRIGLVDVNFKWAVNSFLKSKGSNYGYTWLDGDIEEKLYTFTIEDYKNTFILWNEVEPIAIFITVEDLVTFTEILLNDEDEEIKEDNLFFTYPIQEEKVSAYLQAKRIAQSDGEWQ